MTVTYREWKDGDDLALLELWPDAGDHQSLVDRALLQGRSDAPFARGIVAEDEGIPVAAGSVAVSPLHPERAWIYVEVAPQVRRQGIGAELARRLAAELSSAASSGASPTAQLKARWASAGNPGAERLAARLGLETIQVSRQVEVAPKAVPFPDFEDASAGTRHVTDIATGSVELTLAAQRFYDAVHASWDPAVTTPGQIARMLLSPQAGAHGALVVRSGSPLPEDAPEGARAGAIRAFAISYAQERAEPGDEAADVLIGWDPETDEDTQIRAIADLLGVMAAERPVSVEVDSSMAPLVRVLAALEKDGTARVTSSTTIAATRGEGA
ncbi:GNAT family N-acetyltransferase [Falsarthrobacter nasiphocae]|uniref:GNAT superfamily N-acetyltransferase n=1 Tax=Falsarthrobacter nasiphocae TaxID=189863 RepID=A0AAE3YFS1_9MICC|nr:GNAT family N-acetyltransferase [Falsarthrobacter nasiphocae]MDR6892619.1 GNAT superfamily N-acetyltransferase [Falsarthrobacter nasiphocae]